jgi:hypothetical protein
MESGFKYGRFVERREEKRRQNRLLPTKTGEPREEKMKEIFTAPNVIPCDLLKVVLEANGIPSHIKNSSDSTIAGIGYLLPLCLFPSLTWPEVWVQDEYFQRASEIVSELQKEKSETNELRSFRRDMLGRRVLYVQRRGRRNEGNVPAEGALRRRFGVTSRLDTRPDSNR